MISTEIAEFVGGQHHGPAVELVGVGPLDSAGGDLLAYAEAKVTGEAGCVLCREPVDGRACIVVEDPKLAFIKVLRALFSEEVEPGVHPTAVVEGSLGAGVEVGPHAVIGRDSVVGDGCRIGAGVVIGEGCHVGEGTVIFPRAVLYDNTWVGPRCRIHAGAVLGADGFSFHPTPKGPVKVPQVGRVVILEGTEIGANTCVDRAFLTETVVGPGAATDNLVQIGHNCEVGAEALIAAQVGLSGSVKVGAGAVLGGQVGVREHIEIGAGALVGGGSGVVKNLPGGEAYFGTPAIPIAEGRRAYMAWPKLPEILKRLRKLEGEKE